jgi:16S rRNA (uracil1498-N3)-methyltransferase
LLKSSTKTKKHTFKMTRRRFYAPPGAFSPERKSLRLATEEVRHLRDVLRLEAGAEVYVFDGGGREFQCAVESYARDFAELRVIAEVQPAHSESPLELTLALALLKGEKFDLVVQKATELGVTGIVPTISERADVRLRDAGDAGKRVARWQRIALEAAKQSGRARVPEVRTPLGFSSLMETFSTFSNSPGLSTSALRLMFSERDGQSLNAAIETPGAKPSQIIALVGSEGGWTGGEIGQARESGWKIVTLGGRVLRAETAAITVIALLQNLLGDLN